MIPTPDAGAGFSGSEVLWVLRSVRADAKHGAALPSLSAIRARIAARRVDRYLDHDEPRFLTSREAAFLCARSRAYILALLRAGRLEGRLVTYTDPKTLTDRMRWEIDPASVREYAMREACGCETTVRLVELEDDGDAE
jgi:hypothetical protein